MPSDLAVTRVVVDSMIDAGRWYRPEPEDLAEVARMVAEGECSASTGKFLLRYIAVQAYVKNVYKPDPDGVE